MIRIAITPAAFEAVAVRSGVGGAKRLAADAEAKRKEHERLAASARQLVSRFLP
jgi:hypothetical protein